MQKKTILFLILCLAVPALAGAYFARHWTKPSAPDLTETASLDASLTTAKPSETLGLPKRKIAGATSAAEVSAKLAILKAQRPTFDIAQIDPEGTSVFAGQAAPNSMVTIHVDGKIVGSSQTDDSGEWTAIVEHDFPRDSRYELGLSVVDESLPSVIEGQVVSVEPAEEVAPSRVASARSTDRAEPSGVLFANPFAKEASKPIAPKPTDRTSRTANSGEYVGREFAALGADASQPKAHSSIDRDLGETSSDSRIARNEPDARELRRQPTTAKAVTDRMMRNLEELIATAKQEANDARKSKPIDRVPVVQEPSKPVDRNSIAAVESYQMRLAAKTDRALEANEPMAADRDNRMSRVVPLNTEAATSETVQSSHTEASTVIGAGETVATANQDKVRQAESAEMNVATASEDFRPSANHAREDAARYTNQFPSRLAAPSVERANRPLVQRPARLGVAAAPRIPSAAMGEDMGLATDLGREAKFDDEANQQIAVATTPRTDNVVPIPIKFVFEEANFTPAGERAVALLLTYVKIKNFKSITLSGHADERGEEPYNLELSEARLDAVAAYLRSGGYGGELTLRPKGELEPFQGVDRERFELEELYQLDRRVELHLQ